jgi:hypothetical protein
MAVSATLNTSFTAVAQREAFSDPAAPLRRILMSYEFTKYEIEILHSF